MIHLPVQADPGPRVDEVGGGAGQAEQLLVDHRILGLPSPGAIARHRLVNEVLQALKLLGVPLRLPDDFSHEHGLEEFDVVQDGQHDKSRKVTRADHPEVPRILPQFRDHLVAAAPSSTPSIFFFLGSVTSLEDLSRMVGEVLFQLPENQQQAFEQDKVALGMLLFNQFRADKQDKLHKEYALWCSRAKDGTTDEVVKEFNRFLENLMVRSSNECFCETVGSVMKQKTGRNRVLDSKHFPAGESRTSASP